MLIGQAEEVLCPQGHTALQHHAEGDGEGDGLLCMSLPQSPLLFSSHYIPSHYPFTGYTSPLHRLYYLYHFALSSHTQAQVLYLCTILTHTSTSTLSLHYPHTHKHKYSIFALSSHTHKYSIFALSSHTQAQVLSLCTIHTHTHTHKHTHHTLTHSPTPTHTPE